MLWQRIREMRNPEQLAGTKPETCSSAFMPFPVLAIFSAAQQAQIVEIYRIASERTRAQQTSRARSRIPQFSIN
jgi:hypothetical protein